MHTGDINKNDEVVNPYLSWSRGNKTKKLKDEAHSSPPTALWICDLVLDKGCLTDKEMAEILISIVPITEHKTV
jgi:hypothetical protein